MSNRPWYKRYGGDFVFGTMSLSLEEKGAYSLCLDLIYDRGGPIPDDARWLAGVCGVSVRKWNALRQALLNAGKLEAREGFLTNSRAEKEIETSAETSRKHAENGAKGGNKSGEKLDVTSENRSLGEAGLKPIQIPEPEPDIEDAKSASSIAPPPTFNDVWEAYPHRQGRSRREESEAAWDALDLATQTAMPAALRRFKPHVGEIFGGKGAPNMARWLREGGYLDWLTDHPSPQQPPTEPWRGPAEFRADVVAAHGEDFARAYLDPAGWKNGDARHVLARTGTAADRMRQELRPLLAKHGMTVRHERATH